MMFSKAQILFAALVTIWFTALLVSPSLASIGDNNIIRISEPSSLLLLGSGIAGLAGLTWARRRK